MIFSAPRFVVVDDKEQHLLAITRTFHQLGTPCLGIRYDPAQELNQLHFRGVRCLFMDLHLVDGQASTDERRHYGLIASILEDNISQDGGPFVLVVWTEHPHLSAELQVYLDKNLDAAKPHTRPLAVLSLAKEKFINVEDGGINSPPELQQAVEQAIGANPQLAALLGWEADVLRAAGDTLASLLALVPVEDRASANYSAALDTILSRLARETVGKSHVAAAPRTAVTTALAPILTDRIQNQDVPEETQDIWKKAVTRSEDQGLGPASDKEAGEINRMLHLAVPGSEVLLPSDWGAVVAWPFEWTDAELQRWTGLTIKQMACEEFKLRSSAITLIKPVLIRVGATCDYAQNNRGPIPFLLGLCIPEKAERQDSKPSDAVWRSPVFIMPGAADPSRLYAHFRFPQSHLPANCVDWKNKVLCRLREQLLMQLVSATSTYVARPGIVELRTS